MIAMDAQLKHAAVGFEKSDDKRRVLLISSLLGFLLFVMVPLGAGGADSETAPQRRSQGAVEARHLVDLRVDKRPDGTQIVVTGDGKIGVPHTFTLSDPRRIVIDLRNVERSFEVNRIPVKANGLLRLRIGSHPDKVRLVLDLDDLQEAIPRYGIRRVGNELYVSVGHAVVEPSGESVHESPVHTTEGRDGGFDDASTRVTSGSAHVPSAADLSATPTVDLQLASASSESSDSLMEGIEQYKEENYEEAVEVLIKARDQNPESSQAAFFLGMAYKQIIDYPNAAKHLKDAVTLEPRVDQAVVELIDVLYLLDELEEAKHWIEVAEKEEISPANIAFLKGAVLQKEGKDSEAIESFEKAKSLDESIAQTADFQIAMSLMKEKKYEEAQERLGAAAVANPQTDLATFARYYGDILDRRIARERPLHAFLGLYGQYDSNVVLEPESASPTVTGITDTDSNVLVTRASLNYAPMLPGPWLFNGWVSFDANFHNRFSTTHDIEAFNVFLAPGYNLGRFSVNAVGNYNYYWRHYDGYLSYLNIGPLLRTVLGEAHMLELFGGYINKAFDETPFIPEEDRDSNGLNVYLNWVWLYKQDAFLNLKYEFIDENADGSNWDYSGHRFYFLTEYPLVTFENSLYDQSKISLQLAGEAFFVNYKNPHTFDDLGRERDDDIYRATVALSWEFIRNTSLVLQYDYTRAFSNTEARLVDPRTGVPFDVKFFDYDRSLYTLGVEYRY